MLEAYDRMSELLVAIRCHNILFDIKEHSFLHLSKSDFNYNSNKIEPKICIIERICNPEDFTKLIQKYAKDNETTIIIPNSKTSICFDILILNSSYKNISNIFKIQFVYLFIILFILHLNLYFI